LEFNKDFIDGVVITGGEPTIHPDLPELCRKIKDIGLNIKLDTNGTNPNMLKQLVNSKLVDYVAMDIKAPLDFNAYSKACGIKSEVLFEAVKYSARYLLTNPVDYEFRTTVVPSLHTTADIRQISVNIRGARRYFIQNFVSYNTLDASCSSLTPFDEKQIRAFVNAAQDNVPNTKFRGKFSSLE
jgi:pyruvate formate lyase activating enzyme